MGLKAETEAFPKIQARLGTVDKNNRKVVSVFKLKIRQNGAVVKTMILDLVDLKFYEGDVDADCTMIIDDQDLCDIVNKKADSSELLKQGKFQVEGKVELLKQLKEALSGDLQ